MHGKLEVIAFSFLNNYWSSFKTLYTIFTLSNVAFLLIGLALFLTVVKLESAMLGKN